MRDDARIATLIKLVDMCINKNMPADKSLDTFFRKNRFIGSKDRRFLTDTLWEVLRHRYALEHKAKSSNPRNIVIAYLDGKADLKALFSGENYAPEPITVNEMEFDLSPPPPEMPEFLLKKLKDKFGLEWEEALKAFCSPARLDLRVNTIKASIEDCVKILKAEKTPLSKLGVFLAQRINLKDNELFKKGCVDIQDEGSQLICEFCDIKSGEKVLDICAGAGGKALTLAILMRNSGSITVSDVDKKRMKDIWARAKRTGITIINDEPYVDKNFDAVLIDAPCSGSGTLRRNPDKKWKINEKVVADLLPIQSGLLDRAVDLGDKVVYATCSFIKEENEEQIAAFLQRHPEFKKVKEKFLSPFTSNTDAFYMCMLAKD